MRVFRCLCLLAGFLLLTVPAYADLVTFSSLAAFTAAAPGLPVETFESGLVATASITNCTGPLSGAAASACFPLGGLLPGVVYSSTPEPNVLGLLGGSGVVGNTTKVLGPAIFASTMNLTFTSASAVTPAAQRVCPQPSHPIPPLSGRRAAAHDVRPDHDTAPALRREEAPQFQ